MDAERSLRKHALAVEAAVRGYARQQGATEEEWGVVALLHDFDYERYPTLGDHPNKGCEHLRSLGYPEWVMRAIQSHAWEITGIKPETPLERALVACDEMAGFVTAASLVRPSKSVLDLEACVSDQAHEGQGLCPGDSARTPADGRRTDGAAARPARRQRDCVHASRSGSPGAERHALGANGFGSISVYFTYMPTAADPVQAGSVAPVVVCDQLSVRYGKNWALKDVTATFLPGAIGLLGPNGAGKSTLHQDAARVRRPRQGAA